MGIREASEGEGRLTGGINECVSKGRALNWRWRWAGLKFEPGSGPVDSSDLSPLSGCGAAKPGDFSAQVRIIG